MREWAAIFAGSGAALITGVFAMLHTKHRRDQSEQHADDMARRDAGHGENIRIMSDIGDRVAEVRDDVREVRRRQDDHLEWHAEK